MNVTAYRAGVVLFAMLASFFSPGLAQTYSLGSLQYRPIGPAIAGGRATAVAGSDVDPDVYYAGGAGGGVFKSTDGGDSWSPIFDREAVAPIGAIAVSPRDTNDVWVGTGEANPRNEVESGAGVWHSPDGGKTWKHLGLDDSGSISAISIDPRDSRHVVVAALGQIFRDNQMRGVYLTRDGGLHWTRSLYVNPSVGASDLARVPDRPDTIFAGLYHLRREPWSMTSGGPNGGIFRSDDAGATWRKLAGHGLPSGATGRIGLSAGKRGRIYAIIQAKQGDLWRSDDGGADWKLMPHSWLVGMRPFYFSRVFVDPADNNRLIDVGLILSMSDNGGRSFRKIATNAGWDYHHVFWSANGKRIAIASDEGVVMSSDAGDHWRQPYVLPFAQPYHVGYDDGRPNYHVCIGLQDDSSWCGPANGDSGLGVLNRDWFTVGPGDGMWAVYDPLDPHLIWSTSTSSGTGQVYLWDTRTQQAVEVSPDAELNGDLPAKMLRHRFNWDTPIAFTHDGKALVGGDRVFESADHGQHWAVISPDLTRDEKAHQQIPGGPVGADMSGAEIADTILEIAPSAKDARLIWVGTDDGLVRMTRDAGANWADVTPRGMPHWARVPAVEPGGFDPGTAFAVGDNHMSGDDAPYIFATADYGATWSSLAGDMPKNLFVRSIRQDPKNPALLYAGTQRGVWASWDRGTHWQPLRLNMPATAIYDMHIHPRTNDLIVATHGRGVWILDDLQAVQQRPAISPSQLTLLDARETSRWWRWPIINSFENGSLPGNVFAAPNVDYGVLITYSLPSRFKKAPTIDVLDAQGTVVRHLSGKSVPNKAGLNRTSWDLQEDGPAKWLGTFKDNQGPSEGAEVVPGSYTLRLQAGGMFKEARAVVSADPRDTAAPDSYRARHDFLARLLSDLGGVDKMLNDIDRKLNRVSGARRIALLEFQHRLTYNPRNAEDFGEPAALRERLQDLISRVSSTSYQAPTQADLEEAARLKAVYAAVEVAARSI